MVTLDELCYAGNFTVEWCLWLELFLRIFKDNLHGAACWLGSCMYLMHPALVCVSAFSRGFLI